MLSVLVIIPFNNVYPPMNGGMIRCINLLNQLSIYFNVTALIKQDKDLFSESFTLYPGLKNCNIISTKNKEYRTDIFSWVPARIHNAIKFRYLNRSLSEATNSEFLLLLPQLIDFIKKSVVDIVIIEDISILGLARIIRKFCKGAILIYDAYNVNTVMAYNLLEKGEIKMKEFKAIKTAETKIFKRADKIFACSHKDLMELCTMNKNYIEGLVVPNGVNLTSKMQKEEKGNGESNFNLIFCGSMDYLPNREGMIWFMNNVFHYVIEKIPEVKLIIIGKGDCGPELAKLLNHKSVRNYGMVSDVGQYYKKAAIAIVPLLSGSGTRLKILEAVAYHIPVISTSIGAEGLLFKNEHSIYIADDARLFADIIFNLFKNKILAENVAEQAFLLAKKEYDWNIVGKRMAEYLNNLKGNI